MKHSLLKGFYLRDLLIEPTSGTVSGPNGTAHLQPKAIELLLYLAERPFTLIERDVLLHAVWGQDHGSQQAVATSGKTPDNVLGIEASGKVTDVDWFQSSVQR